MGQSRPENDARLKISVIICTLNRGDLPGNVVTALLTKQTYGNFEIVVVDQSDTPCPESYRDPVCLDRVRYIHLEEKNLPNARNVGMAHADGEIFVFLDDDVEPDADLLRFHALNYGDRAVGGVAGRILEKIPLMNTPVPGGRVSRSGRVLMNFESMTKQPVRSACGGNMSFSREAAEKTGGFDPRFGGQALLEETDFCYRIRAAGFEIIYEPGAWVHHLRAGSGGCRPGKEREALYTRFRNTALFFRKNMSPLLLPWVFAVHVLIALKKIFQSKIGIGDFFHVFAGFFHGLGGYQRRDEKHNTH